jgi:hypothetical protein
MFARGLDTYIVFDERRPIDLSALRGDRVLGNATIRLLPAATLLQLRLQPDRVAVLAQVPQGWRISILATRPGLRAIVPVQAEGRITLAADAPGQVVTMLDPDSGTTLLIGTQRQAGQGMLTPRRSAEYSLLPTTQGVVAEPLSDRVALRVAPAGFTLSGEPDGLQLSSSAGADNLLTDAIALTRRFQFPTMPTQQLSVQLVEQLDDIAAVPPQARGLRRLAAARSLLALGLAVEAQAMLQIAAEQAPREGMSAELAGLSGIAALLAGRTEESAGVTDARLTGTDEIALWRAVRGATLQEGSPRAASTMAATAPLALTYPPAMRDRILPIILETMILGGETHAAASLLTPRKDEPGLGFARALLKQAEGDVPGALAEYDALTNGHDQRDRRRAGSRAVELRLSSGQIDARQAADQLDKMLYAWRGDSLELTSRQRMAELRQQAGAWGPALATLRATEADFPDVAAITHGKLQETFAALLKDDVADKLPPLELVALVDANADLLPSSAEGEALEARLADRVLALDLPQRADPLLDKLIRSAPTALGRATFGERLAALRLREGDAAKALTALESSDATEELPAELTQRRTLLFADANARLGRIGAATAALATLGTPAADEARATILERVQDWPAAEQALRDYLARTLPETGPLDDAQRSMILRLATAAARAGDDVTLSGLRSQNAERIGDGPLGDMFRLLTADPIRASGDLKRAAQEAGLVRSIPNGLKALQSGAPSR